MDAKLRRMLEPRPEVRFAVEQHGSTVRDPPAGGRDAEYLGWDGGEVPPEKELNLPMRVPPWCRCGVLAALLLLLGCSESAPITGDAAAAGDGPTRDGPHAGDASSADGSRDGPAGDGLLRDRCEPSAALVGRVDAARMLADLNALVGLGDRYSHAGQTDAASYLRDQLVAAGLAAVDRTYAFAGSTWVNLEVTIAGVEAPGEFVMAGGHYDSGSGTPGADDNASGTVAVLEAARALASCQPRRNVRLVFFSNEEAGTIGSQAYAAQLKTTVPITSLKGFIAMDMVAYPDATRDLHLATVPANEPLARAMETAVAQWTTLATTVLIDQQCG
jgi:hypothetical protein